MRKRFLVKLIILNSFFLFGCSSDKATWLSEIDGATPYVNLGRIDWLHHFSTETRDNTNNLNPNSQIDAIAGNDYFNDVVTDSDGNIYIAGNTASDLNDTFGGGSSDIFIMKLNSESEIQWVTHVGTSTRDNTNGLDPNGQIDAVDVYDRCSSIALDSLGNIYCAGDTTSSLNDNSSVLLDAFIMKLNSNGVVQWVTHLGTDTRDNANGKDPNGQVDAVNLAERCYDVAVDSLDNVYCVGSTASSLNDTNGGSSDAFVMKLDSSGIIEWVTQLGTDTRDNLNGKDPNGQVDAVAGNDICFGISIDSDDNIFCAGATASSLNDTLGGSTDIFVMKMDSSGVIDWITHAGTDTRDNANGKDPNGQVDAVNATDYCISMALDSDGNIYCSGYTSSSFNDTFGGSFDAIVLKLDSSGVIQWVTQVGTDTRDNLNGLDPNNQVSAVNGEERCYGIAVDDFDNVYCAGHSTGSFNDTAGGAEDALVIKLNSTTGAIEWSTHLGQDTRDNLNGLNPNSQVSAVNLTDSVSRIVVDSFGYLYAAGSTASSLNGTNGGLSDVFIMKIY